MLSLEGRRKLAEVIFADLLYENIRCPHLCEHIKRYQPTMLIGYSRFFEVEYHSSNIVFLELFNRCAMSFNRFEKLYLESDSKNSFMIKIVQDLGNG